MTEVDFPYDNRTGRPPGRVVRAMGLLLPGVRRVWSQVEPYADAWHAANRAALQEPGRRWIVLGDSMSQGIGATSPERGWVGQLHRRLADDGHDLVLVNLSATGARVPDLLDQQLPALASIEAREDDVVTVLVGSNDMFAGAESREALPEAFRALLERLPRGAVVATLPPNRSVATSTNVHIAAAGDAGRVRVVDLATAGPSSWRGKLAADFFHPNDVGYAAIADAFEPLVRRAVTDRSG